MKDTSSVRYRFSDINDMHRDAFVAVFGGVFEDSPWVAGAAWQSRPFKSNAHVVEALCEVVRNAGRQRQLALLCAHPELGATKPLTGYSAREQDKAGLQQGQDERVALLADLNRRYRDKFGFPFIIAVKGLDPDRIIECFRERLDNSLEDEFAECLGQVFRIAGFRFEELLGDVDED